MHHETQVSLISRLKNKQKVAFKSEYKQVLLIRDIMCEETKHSLQMSL